MNHRAWDIMIEANGIYDLLPTEIARVIELEEKGFDIHYVTQDEFEYVEESLHAVMRFVDPKLLNENGRISLYVPKPGMKDRLERYFGIEEFIGKHEKAIICQYFERG